MPRPKGFKCSPETIARMAESQRKRMADPAVRARISLTSKAAWERRKQEKATPKADALPSNTH